MDACHRGRLHQLNANNRAYRCAHFRGIKHQGGKWSASIKDPRLYLHDGRCHIGTFNSPETAAAAYDFALIALGHTPHSTSTASTTATATLRGRCGRRWRL